MKEKSKWNIDFKSLSKQFGKYKYVILIIGIGLFLLLVPTSGSRETKVTNVSNTIEDFSVEAMEEKLEGILSQIEGAGRIDVMLTIECGMKHIFAQDGTKEKESDKIREERETVIVSSGAGIQGTVLVQQIYPRFQGAFIVAEGGGDPAVRLNITKAVAALTGLGADKISVCKGK